MQPKYRLILKDGETFTAKEVETLTFLMNNNLQVISASYRLLDQEQGADVKQIAIVDEYTAWLYQSTGAYDKVGKLIYHGDLLQDAEGVIYEVMYAVGSYFIVKDEQALMLLDNVVRGLTVIGNVIQNYDLIKVDTSVLETN